eukprot:scaffold5178_cov141-Skeletonema_menzelii.AAC.7
MRTLLICAQQAGRPGERKHKQWFYAEKVFLNQQPTQEMSSFRLQKKSCCPEMDQTHFVVSGSTLAEDFHAQLPSARSNR